MIRRTYGKGGSTARDSALTLEGGENPYSAPTSAVPPLSGSERAASIGGRAQSRPSLPSHGVGMDVSTLKNSMKATEYATHKPPAARHTFTSPAGKTTVGKGFDFNSNFGGLDGTPGAAAVQSVSELLLSGESAASVDDFEFTLGGLDPSKSPVSVSNSIKELMVLLQTPNGRAVARARGYTTSAMDKCFALTTASAHRSHDSVCFSIACLLALLAGDSRSVTAFTKTGVQSLIELVKIYCSKAEGVGAAAGGCLPSTTVAVTAKSAWVAKSSTAITPGASSGANRSISPLKSSLLATLSVAVSGLSLTKEAEGIDVVLTALSSLLQVQNAETTSESPSLEFMSRYVSNCKDWTRLYGGIPALCSVIEAASARFSSASDPDPKHIRRFLSAALILENLTFLSTANQNAVCAAKAPRGVSVFDAVLKVAFLAGVAAVDVSPAQSSRSWVLDCLFGCLRFLINVTHDNIAACDAVFKSSVVLTDDTTLSGLNVVSRLLLLASPRTSPLSSASALHPSNVDAVTDRSRALLPDVAAASFDLLLLLAGLLTNLTEHCDAIRDALSALDVYSCAVSSSASSSGRKRPREGGENALAAFAQVFLSTFDKLRMDVTGWTWPQDRGKGVDGSTPRTPQSHEDTLASPVACGDVDLLTPKPRAPPQWTTAPTDPVDSESVSVEDIVACAHLSLMLGCCMRDNGFAQACVKRALPNSSLVPLGVVLNSFIKLQMDAGVLAETTILAMKSVLDELCDMDHSRVGVRAMVPTSHGESAINDTLLLAPHVPRKAVKPSETATVEETPLLFAPVRVDRRKLLSAASPVPPPKPPASPTRTSLPIAVHVSPVSSVKPSADVGLPSAGSNKSPSRPVRPAVVSPTKHSPAKPVTPAVKRTPPPTSKSPATAGSTKPAFIMSTLTTSDDDDDDSDGDFVNPPKFSSQVVAVASVGSRASVRTYGGRK